MSYNGKPVMQKQGPAACPAEAKCCTCLFCEAGGCVYPNSTECWSPGPGQDISSDLPNCLIIGDSVSNQYTPVVTSLLNSTCKVQHAPWVGGGSANNAENGLKNLQGKAYMRLGSLLSCTQPGPAGTTSVRNTCTCVYPRLQLDTGCAPLSARIDISTGI